MPTTFTEMNTDVETISSRAFKHGLKLNKNKTQTDLIGQPKLLLKNIDSTNAHIVYLY